MPHQDTGAGATHTSQDKKRWEDSAGSVVADNYWWERKSKFQGGLTPGTNGIIKSSFCIASIWLPEHLFTRGWCLRGASGPIDQSGGAVTFTCQLVIFNELGVWGCHLAACW